MASGVALGAGWGEGAQFKGRLNGAKKNEYFKSKRWILCAQQILNCWTEEKGDK